MSDEKIINYVRDGRKWKRAPNYKLPKYESGSGSLASTKEKMKIFYILGHDDE